MDQRIGVPFSWYFYTVHRNRVENWAGQQVIKAAEQGLLVLPECDYRVLKRWGRPAVPILGASHAKPAGRRFGAAYPNSFGG